jgi:isoquinoline 1-oxidoreductase
MRITVNGSAQTIDPQPERSLLHVLREELALTAAKPGCGEGECGACTVLLDREPIRSCVRPIAEVAGREVATLEHLRDETVWHAVAEAFAEVRAFQCGYCTPGMVVAAGALLTQKPAPTDQEIIAALDGNVCRCGAYPRILRAVRRASEALARGNGTALAATANDATARPVPGFAGGKAKIPWDLQEPSERDYFKRLGDGLVVVLTPDESENVNERTGGAWSTEGGAWLHVATHGRVTAFSGKVDVGQDNRTALTMLVAEELGVDADSVELVMGDTDFCPADIGTFGSRSTEDAGGVLKAVAATAREWLSSHRAEGRQIVFAKGKTPTRSPTEWRVAGGAAARTSASGIVRGTTRYGSDLSLPGMLHGRVVRPPSWNAELESVDVSHAQSLLDVSVVRHADFVGVAAPDPLRARAALGAIDATWRSDPQPTEHEIDDYLRTHPLDEQGWEGAFHDETGNVERALAEGSISLSATYTTAYLAHVPLETRGAVAEWRDDRVTVWAGTQRPFGVREDVAEALGIDQDRVRVIVPPTGSGYGGKHSNEAAVEAARLARATGRPVKVRWSRTEEFAWGYFRPASVIDVRSALGPDGRLTAWDFSNVNSGPFGIRTPYAIPNERLEYQPADSPLRQGSYRALAATANTFARESHIDELALAGGADPLQFRLANLRDDRVAAVLGAAAEAGGWNLNAPRTGAGRGIACGVDKGSRIATYVEVAGTALTRIVTAFECGAIVDPDNLRNQVEGATVMGLGGALFEAVHFENGRPTNGSMTAYRVPRFSDVPPIEVILIDRRDLPSAGAGETPIIAIAPAIANAIYAATGRRIRSMPLLPAPM